MANYALLNYNNVVTKVVTGKDEDSVDHNMELIYQDIFKQVCKRTSYNTHGGIHSLGGTPFRKNYAGIGYTYDEDRDAFIPPRPEQYPSWIIDDETCQWKAPVDYPTDGQEYEWNEENQSWNLIT